MDEGINGNDLNSMCNTELRLTISFLHSHFTMVILLCYNHVRILANNIINT